MKQLQVRRFSDKSVHNIFARLIAEINTEASYLIHFLFSSVGCSTMFQGVTKSQPLVRLDLVVEGSYGISNVTNHRNCSIEKALYFDERNWKRLGSREKDAFAIAKIKEWPYTKLQVGCIIELLILTLLIGLLFLSCCIAVEGSNPLRQFCR